MVDEGVPGPGSIFTAWIGVDDGASSTVALGGASALTSGTDTSPGPPAELVAWPLMPSKPEAIEARTRRVSTTMMPTAPTAARRFRWLVDLLGEPPPGRSRSTMGRSATGVRRCRRLVIP